MSGVSMSIAVVIKKIFFHQLEYKAGLKTKPDLDQDGPTYQTLDFLNHIEDVVWEKTDSQWCTQGFWKERDHVKKILDS